MSRELSKVMAEGMEKTLEAMELMKKQVAGTLTAEESTRLAMLNGNLLALAGQAVDLGYDPQAALASAQRAAEAPVYRDEVEVQDEDEDFEDMDGGLYDIDDLDSEEDNSDEELCWCGDRNCGG